MKQLKIEDHVGQEIYVHLTEPGGHNSSYSRMIGTIEFNPNYSEISQEYKIRFRNFDAVYLCSGSHIIIGKTKKDHPEYFL